VAGDVLEATRDAKLALDFIGDSDLRQAQRYLKVRNERLVAGDAPRRGTSAARDYLKMQASVIAGEKTL